MLPVFFFRRRNQWVSRGVMQLPDVIGIEASWLLKYFLFWQRRFVFHKFNYDSITHWVKFPCGHMLSGDASNLPKAPVRLQAIGTGMKEKLNLPQILKSSC